MNYYIIRNTQRFGPYNVDALAHYVGEGGILMQDTAVAENDTKEISVREALKLAGVAGEVAKLERAVLEEIRARGGAKRETRTVVERYTPIGPAA